MKKVMLCAIALATFIGSQAQNKKGNLLVGVTLGSGGYSSSENDYMYSTSPTVYNGDSKSFYIGISPDVGLYLTDRLILGAYVGLSYSNGKSHSGNSTTTTTSTSESNSLYFSAGPYSRLYLGKMNSKGMPYVQINTGLSFYPSDNGEGFNSTNTTHYTYKTKNYFNWSLGPRVGYEHFFNEHIGMHYYIGYNYSKSKYKYEYDYTVGGTDYSYEYNTHSHNINFGVGLQMHLNCKKKK
jgi:hypothetical protein